LGEEMRRAASIVMVTLLLAGTLALAFNIQTAKAYYYYNFTITVIPESPTIQNKVNVTVSLETACINYVVNFSTRSQSGKHFSITIDIYVPQICLPAIGWAAETYNLGKLLADTYSFNAEVRVWEKETILVDSISYSKSFTVAYAITVPDDYPTIQEAINNANEGDSIFVRNGTYYENVVINKTVSLIGENPINTIIDGGKTGSVVYVRAINSSISGFTIQNSGTSNRASGVRVSHSSGNNISLNVITNNDCGIFIYGSSKNTMSNNTINANRIYGIHLWSSSNNTLTNNTISNNYNGIIKEGSSNNILKNNTAFGNLYNFGVGGWELSHFVHDIDTSNKVDGKSIQYLVNKKDIVIDSSWDVGYLCLVNSTNMTIKDLALTIRNWHGIKLAYTKNSRIENVTISRTSYAIDFSRSSNNIVINTNILNRNGIRLSASNDNTIINNSISSTWDAFYFHLSNNNTITGNHINNNEHGIRFYSSSTNKIYNNNFISNMNQAYVSSDSLNNIWDNGYPSGGNYWSNHACGGNPSYGSQPYIIDADNIDRYPFQDPNGWLLHQLTVFSSPIIGITFTVDGVPQTTPYTEWLSEGSYTLEMPETHNGYVWSHWLEDGDPNRTKTVTLPATTYTAIYITAPIGGTTISIESGYLSLWITSILLIISLVVTSGLCLKRKS